MLPKAMTEENGHLTFPEQIHVVLSSYAHSIEGIFVGDNRIYCISINVPLIRPGR